jgi:hypothetical protein
MSVEPEAQCLSDEREADPFLFETYAVSEVVFDEIDIALAFLVGEVGERFGREARVPGPLPSVFEQGCPVHQHRLHGRQSFPQAVEDREAVRVDVAPVDTGSASRHGDLVPCSRAKEISPNYAARRHPVTLDFIAEVEAARSATTPS